MNTNNLWPDNRYHNFAQSCDSRGNELALSSPSLKMSNLEFEKMLPGGRYIVNVNYVGEVTVVERLD